MASPRTILKECMLSTEIEIKLQVPVHARSRLEAAVAAGRSQRTHLQATYFDTADRRLAAAGIALRLRKEGRRLVQTVKAAGKGLMERLEHNVDIGPAALQVAGDAALIDPRRHTGTPAGELLERVLAVRPGERAVSLIAVYRTDIWRRHRALRTNNGTVEVAYDRGVIIAGERRLTVSELEIELLRGKPEAVIDVARRWASRHGLWIDVRSKAERGERLARQEAFGAPIMSATVNLRRSDSPAKALQALLGGGLAEVLRNASQISSGSYDDEHVHQMRVGLRRLRTALRLFEGASPGIDGHWPQALAEVFRQLGVVRDRDVLLASVLPRLREAGAPLVEVLAARRAADRPGNPQSPDSKSRDRAAPDDESVRVVRASEFTQLALELQRFVLSGSAHARAAIETLPAGGVVADDEQADDAQADLRRWLAPRLQRWHRQVRQLARQFQNLDGDARHTLRKRVKRLRYAVEFVATIHGRKKVKAYLARLEPSQEGLGRYNDLSVALVQFKALVPIDPRAWFALGWLTATRADLVIDIDHELKGLRRARPFWR